MILCYDRFCICIISINDSFRLGKQEFLIRLSPEGEALGLRQAQLATQVRQAFYGEEAQRLQRNRDDVKVMVRYPLSERKSVRDLQEMFDYAA